jgi:hypothetical protein
MAKSKDQLRDYLIKVMTVIREDVDKIKQVKKGMKSYRILPGKVQSYFNNPELVNELDIETVYFLTEQVYTVTENTTIYPTEYFTPREIKEIKSNFEGYESEKIEFPYTFKNVLKGNEDDYMLYIKASEIKKLYENSLLQWNPKTQREARQSKKGDQIIETPKIVEKSVKDMEDLLEKGEMISTVITFNARLSTTDDESGEELIYSEGNMSLTITKGSLLDVLDGFHRINSIVRALRKNPSLDETFKVNILHKGQAQAEQYFKQLNTTNPVGQGHLKKMGETRQADFIAKQLQYNSELKNKVAASDMIAPNSDFLVTFNVLSDSIDEVFNIEDKPTAIKVSRYLTQFINELFFSFPNEFMGDIAEERKNTLLNANSLFYGYFTLAKNMRDNDININQISNILGDINFSRDNKLWQDYKIIDENKRINRNPQKLIVKFFNDIDLSKYKEGVNVE